MKVLKVYEYANCSTCKKALKFLSNQRYAYEKVDITQNPPSMTELKAMLTLYGGNYRRLFNTSGHAYQDMNLKDKLTTMSAEDALKLLAKNGRLIKRPFVLFDGKGVVGFELDVWKKIFS